MSRTTLTVERKTALCYVRLSVTKNASDLTSPERQRANIQAACDKNGWIAEWYEDVDGHKSASREKNRPGWLALKARLTDPDIAAVVVNEQSRAMRNAWRAIKLFEELPGYGVKLHMAAADRTLDITTPDGRMNAYLQAFMDDLYVLDASRRSADSVKYRNGRGVSIGIPPFGTIRDDDGYLTPTPHGAWVLPDGSAQPGLEGEELPHPDAVWRGYYDCAKMMLTTYKDNQHGYKAIARILHDQGWFFRDRWNQPRVIKQDDVRRVVSNWREYAGLIPGGRAKEKIADQIENPVEVLRDTGHAVFDLELLRAVALAQETRSNTTRPTGAKKEAHPYALANLVYCAHCERHAAEQDDPKLRSRLIGWTKVDKHRYRHSEANRCETGRKSRHADEIEGDFARLVAALDVRPEAVELMAEMAVTARYRGEAKDETDFEETRRLKIAKHKRALRNNLMLFQDGDIEPEEYYRVRDFHERQLAIWENKTTDRQRVQLELTRCVEMLKRLKEFWDVVDKEDKQMLARSLFDEVIYDLDAGRIVDFTVKSWAEPFLQLRSALYEDELTEEQKHRFVSSGGTFHDPNGTRTRVFTLKG